jgi:hypothetical protein
MKSINKYLTGLVIAVSMLAGLNACKEDYLEPQPYGRY